MFSKKLAILIAVFFFITVNFTILILSSKDVLSEKKIGIDSIGITLISPFQIVVFKIKESLENIWESYFSTVSALKENFVLKNKLSYLLQIKDKNKELEFENKRLRKFINFQNSIKNTLVVAEVIARDPSPWFGTIMINKGSNKGLVKGLPVLVPQGIVGRLISVAKNSSKVLLIIDRNSAVDALIQNSRTRGIVKGNNTKNCFLKYAFQKDEIKVGQVIISSGLDQVFPKGLRIGTVLKVRKKSSLLFQEIFIKTCVDFTKLEEVLVSIKEIDTGKKYND